MGFSILKGSPASLQYAVPPQCRRGSVNGLPAPGILVTSSSSRSSVKFRVLASQNTASSGNKNEDTKETVQKVVEVDDEEDYEEETWLEEKLADAYEFTATAVQAVPGPRVGGIPWLVAGPAAYVGISFLWSIIRLFQRYNSARFKKRRQIGKNALLCEKLDEFFSSNRAELTEPEFKKIVNKFGFTKEEIFRKYLRYAMNEHPFSTDLVADLIQLRNVTQLTSVEVADILNDVSARVVKAKGPIMMDTEGMTEKGIKRKAAVQGLFTKLYYLSEVEEFCSASVRSKLRLKEIFGITDEDVDTIRIETLSDAGNVAALEEMMEQKDVSDGGETDGNESD